MICWVSSAFGTGFGDGFPRTKIEGIINRGNWACGECDDASLINYAWLVVTAMAGHTGGGDGNYLPNNILDVRVIGEELAGGDTYHLLSSPNALSPSLPPISSPSLIFSIGIRRERKRGRARGRRELTGQRWRGWVLCRAVTHFFIESPQTYGPVGLLYCLQTGHFGFQFSSFLARDNFLLITWPFLCHFVACGLGIGEGEGGGVPCLVTVRY